MTVTPDLWRCAQSIAPRVNDGKVGRDRRARRFHRVNSARPAVAPYPIADDSRRIDTRVHRAGGQKVSSAKRPFPEHFLQAGPPGAKRFAEAGRGFVVVQNRINRTAHDWIEVVGSDRFDGEH